MHMQFLHILIITTNQPCHMLMKCRCTPLKALVQSSCCSPPPFAFACCSSISRKYSKPIVLLSLVLCYIDLGMKVTLLKNVLHLTDILLAIQIERCTLLQTIAYFLKHDVIKLFQPQHNGDSTTHQNESKKPIFQYWTPHFHCYQDSKLSMIALLRD